MTEDYNIKSGEKNIITLNGGIKPMIKVFLVIPMPIMVLTEKLIIGTT